MKIDIKTNIKEVTKDLSKTQKKQIPFATANAINTTLFQLRKEMGKQTTKHLHNPTKATQGGFMVHKANKTNLFGFLFLKDFVENYLRFQIDGGVRSPGHRFAIPTKNSKLNKFGNIIGKRAGLIKKDTQFFGTVGGVTGVFERFANGQKVKLIHVLAKSATYTSKFPFYKIGRGFVNSKFNKNMIVALNKALKSAK
jgi:hypothetical protein